MNVPANILKYADELVEKTKDPTATLSPSDLSKLAECQSWLVDFYENNEPHCEKQTDIESIAENIVEMMYE